MTEPLYDCFDPREFGLSPSEWDVAVEKFKTPFGRRVVVYVRHRKTGREAQDTVVGGRLTKNELNKHAVRLIAKLVESLS